MSIKDGIIRGLWKGFSPSGYVKINNAFTFFFFAAPSVLGSMVTFAYHAGAVCCIFTIIRNPRFFSREPIAIRMTAAFYLLIVSYLFSTVLNGHWERMSSLLWLWTFFVFPFSYSIWRISDPVAIARIAAVACSVGAIGGFLLIAVQYNIYDMRGEGGAGNPLVFAAVMALAVAISFAECLRANGWRAVFHLCAAVVGVAAIILSESRGIWPALILNALLAIVVLRDNFRPLSLKSVAYFSLAAAFIAVLFIWIAVPRFAIILEDYQMMKAGNFQTSSGLRLLMWEAGIDAWKGSKLFGLGSGGVREIVSEKIPQGGFTHLHNQFITTMVEAGLLGLVALLTVIAVPTMFAWRTLRVGASQEQRMGALILFSVMITFVTSAMTNIMIHQDIMDTVFVTAIIVGIFLCTGFSAVTDEGDAASRQPTGT